jgi:Peptidase C13 family
MKSTAEPTPPRFGFVHDLVCNLIGGCMLGLLRPRGIEAWRGDGTQLVGLFGVNLAAGLVYDIYAAYPGPGRFDWDGLPAASFWALPLLLSAWLIAQLGRDPDTSRRVLPMAIAGFALAALGSCASTALAVLADFAPTVDKYYHWLVWVPILWVAIAWSIGAPKLADLSGWRAITAASLAALLVIGPQSTADAGARLWVAAGDDQGGDAQSPAVAEQVLYAQSDLLEDALDRIAPGRPGVTELYSIAFAGSGGEDVFLSEALGVNEIMADLFDTGDRSIVLANSEKHAGETPFATVTALQRALATVAERMDEGEDILFLFLTSHGSPDHTLDVSLAPYELEQLTPVKLRALLDESGIRFRVIVVSACYSGGFIRSLANADTMVITASSADRTSFGCRNGRQWTDFGQAYFREALPATGSFEGALQRARDLVAHREAAAKLPASDPQIFVGDAIRERLRAVHTQKLGPRLLVQSGAGAAVTCRAAHYAVDAGAAPKAALPGEHGWRLRIASRYLQFCSWLHRRHAPTRCGSRSRPISRRRSRRSQPASSKPPGTRSRSRSAPPAS